MTPLTEFVDQLPQEWKWLHSFDPPPQYQAEWQAWLAAAQRAETADTLRYWSQRGSKAA